MFGGRTTRFSNSVREFSAPQIFGVLLLGGALLCSAPAAQADVYHPVAAGETLASVAQKYGVSVGALKAANGLQEADGAPLSSMLLRVPNGKEQKGTVSVPVAPVNHGNAQSADTWSRSELPQSESRAPLGPMRGSIAQSMSETIQNGDTWESIAARYVAAGHDVSVEALKRRNGRDSLPATGEKIVVPLGQTTFSDPLAPRIAKVPIPRVNTSAQTAPPKAAPRALGGGVYVANESGAANLPTVKTPSVTVAKEVVPSGAPVFGAATGNLSRGTLPSRGGYGQMARTATGGEVRVLSPGEEAAAPAPSQTAPRTTTRTAPVASTNIARVAKVVASNTPIRRLPQSSAVTLFRCPKGTQLAVLRQSGAWSAVLMSDRSTGWVPTSTLQMTGAAVDVSSQIVDSDGPGGQARWAVGNYKTSSPMVAHALSWLGVRYRYGGTTRRGVDCSSLVQHAFRANGVSLPRTAATQARVGQAVAPANLRAGDRLYFSASGTRIDHTGIYMGDGLFVHASGSGRSVIVSNLFTPRNWNIFVGARR
mgnify:CR=1 FL=1